MNPWLIYFLDGTTFFASLVMVLLSLGLRLVVSKRWIRSLLNLVAILGVILVVLSAVPLPTWTYIVWYSLVVVLLLFPCGKKDPSTGKPRSPKARWICLGCYGLFFIVTLGMFLLELPYHISPSIRADKNATVYIVGDSLSAGIGEEETWPAIYAKKSGRDVVNLAVPGATTKTAMKQLASIPEDPSAIVLVEIGGNDLLGSKKQNFYADLDWLLGELHKKTDRIVLFELPLPPFGNRYGKAQRELAEKYHAVLIPKRYLAQALCTSDGTLDGLHLSEIGHQALADAVERFSLATK
jgi:acyl-CoA thioesterase-1